jgi:PKD repeat protein
VTVSDPPPVASLTVTPSSGVAPLGVTADASASTDTDATPIATYSFDWGDGTAATGAQASPQATHTYTSAGTYTVTVTVTDTAGQKTTTTAQVAAKPNLVGNPGFETNLTGWNTSGSATGVTLTRVSGGHSGSWMAQLATGSTGGTCTLNDSPNWVGATQAGTYDVSLWVRAPTAGAILKLRIVEYNGTTNVGQASASITLTTSWQKIGLTYTPTKPGLSNLDYNAYITGALAGVTCFYADDAAIFLR